MILDKALLIKGLVGATAIAATGTAVWSQWDKILNSFSGEESIVKKAGLTCDNENSTTGSDCTIDATKLKVNQDGTKTENISTASPTSGAKIKLYKVDATSGGYSKGFKLVVEGGDITLTTSSSSTIKLEELETYEIEEEEADPDKKYYLKRKKKSTENIKESLGLPDSCTLEDNVNCSDVVVNTGNIKKIKFDGVEGESNPSISGNAKLTVSKETTDTDFPHKFKFSFKADTSDVTITLSNSKTISLKTTTGTEFKIKKSGSSLTLEKAWTVTTLAQKVGLTCPAEGSTNECSFPTSNTLKLYNGESDKTENGQVSDNTKKLKYEENSADHNQGFKFYAEEEITLSGNDNKKIEASTTATYEIKEHTEGSTKTWYLTKKATSGGAG